MIHTGVHDSLKSACSTAAALCSIAVIGCQSGQPAGSPGAARTQRISEPRVIAVRCLYDQRPWLNLDKAGDRNPEGIRFRAFLDTGSGKGVLRDGTFHVEMYQVRWTSDDQVERKLISDWHYDTSDVHRIAKPGMLGDGYFLHLAWTDRSIPGSEVEIVTK